MPTPPNPEPGPDGTDPFGLTDLRTTVLQAWAASPSRFREDANAEEALAIGGYADRVLIELATNGVDAAREAGEPARLRIWLDDRELRVANVGAPLTRAGVDGLASLRASAKRETSSAVGHFGVGFTAVLALTDSPRVVSRTGGVVFDRRWSAQAVRELGSPELTRELDRRAESVPALRLPWSLPGSEAPVPVGYDTEVRLPLRAEVDIDHVRALIDSGVADLFWALPDLVEVVTPDRTLTRGQAPDGTVELSDGVAAQRFRTASRRGRIPAELLADRPIEERGRDRWNITWVYSLDADSSTDVAPQLVESPGAQQVSYVGAPTPTDEKLSLPARLVGSFPVDDTRRRLAVGPLAEFLLDAAADTYLDLVATLESSRRLELVPPQGFPLGDVDAVLREAVRSRWESMPLLVSAAGEAVSPRSALLLQGAGPGAAALFAEAIPELLPTPPGSVDREALRSLGVETVSLADAVSAVSGLQRPPEFWRDVYDAVADSDPEALAHLAVPLVGGRQVIGAKGCLLPGADVAGLSERAGLIPGLRMVDPAAAHPLLERLGARPADADAILSDPSVRAEIDRALDDLEYADPDLDQLTAFAELIGDLVAAGGAADPEVLGNLLLTEAAGEAWPAGELILPEAPWADLLGEGSEDFGVVGQHWTDRFDVGTLTALGVRDGLRVVRLMAQDGALADLPDVDDWWTECVGDRQPPENLWAVADLDLIDDGRWPTALRMLAADRAARDCLQSAEVSPTYTAWWLSKNLRIDGAPPTSYRLPEAAELAGLYDVCPIDVDPVTAAAVGIRSSLDEVLQRAPAELLERFADPARSVATLRIRELTQALVTWLAVHDEVALPGGVRAIDGSVASAADAVVANGPWWAQVIPASVLVPGGDDPVVTAEALDLELASDRFAVEVLGVEQLDARGAESVASSVAAAGAVLGAQALSVRVVPGLRVSVEGAEAVPVRWWVQSGAPASGAAGVGGSGSGAAGVGGSGSGASGSGASGSGAAGVGGSGSGAGGVGGSGSGAVVDGSPEGVGRAVAWLAGRWTDRQVAVAAAVGNPAALAEESL